MNIRLKTFIALSLALPALLVSTLVIGASSSAGAAETTFDDNQVPIENRAENGSLHIISDDTIEEEVVDPPSMLTTSSATGSTGFCTSADDGACSGNNDLSFAAHLPKCDTTITTDCISGVSATAIGGKQVSATFDRYFPDRGPQSFTGKPSMQLPSGRAPSVWKIPGAPHAAGDEYAVVARLRGNTSRRKAASFQIVLTPVSLKSDADTSGDYQMPVWLQPGRMAGPASDRGLFRCAFWGENGSCLLSRAFPSQTTFSVTVRLAVEPSGWLHGRINDPSITFTKDGKDTVVKVTASPVQVPAFQVGKQYSQFSEAVQKAFAVNGPYGSGGTRQPGGQERTDPNLRNAEYTIASYKDQSFAQLDLMTPVIQDKAGWAPYMWRVRTLSDEEMTKAGECLNTGDGVKGIVTTNASIYGSGPPAFNTKTKTLNYKVAAPHYEKDGVTEFKGVYNLIVRDDIAECFYGFSKTLAAPSMVYAEESEYTEPDVEQYVDATEATYDEVATEADFAEEESFVEEVTLDSVELEEADTTLDEPAEEEVVARVAADVVSELQKTAAANTTIDLSDGWFKFSASNFTFSAPTLKVAMGVKPAKTLTCIAGTSLKKVTAVSPKCPAGYVKAVTKYCIKGKIVDVVVAAAPRCLKKFSAAKAIECGRGASAKRVIALKPKCPKGYELVTSVVCIKNTSVRLVTMVRPQCASGFAKAVSINCAKGKRTTKVTAIKPACPKGYKPKAIAK